MMLNKIKLPDIRKTDEFLSEPPIMPSEGGVFTPIKGWIYPYKGYPIEINVEVLAAIKGIFPVGLKFIEQSIKHFDLLALWSLKNTWQEILLYGGKVLGRQQPKNSKRYGRAVREIYRVLDIQIVKALGHQLKCHWYNFRSILCVTCEWDNAYRYRLQDFLIEMIKGNLVKHPIKELRRLLDLMIQREEREFLKNKWRKLKFILTILLIIKPSIKHKIVEVLMEINQAEIQFEDDDWYCIAMRHDYKFGGFTKEDVIKNKGYEITKVEIKGVEDNLSNNN